MRIAFAGTPEFALPALHALVASSHELVGVLTQPDRPSGRGRHIKPSPVKQAAQTYGLPVAQPLSLRTEEGQAELRAWHPDVLVVVAYGLILPVAVLAMPRLGCLNIHASLLPRWRGAAPIQHAILAGDDDTGVTIMLMDAGLDTGPILAQRRLSIDRGMTSGHLHGLLAVLGAEALLQTVADLASGRVQPRPQSAEGVTRAAKIEKSEALIDWRASALQIERKVRAFDPWPIAETPLEGEPLRIRSAHAEDAGEGTGPPVPTVPPGTIVAVRRDAILVRCGSGSLAITQLQRAGGKPLPAAEFANGGRIRPGQRLG